MSLTSLRRHSCSLCRCGAIAHASHARRGELLALSCRTRSLASLARLAPCATALQATDAQIEQAKDDPRRVFPLFDNLFLEVRIFYSLNAVDLPPYFEDHMAEFMGIMSKYLTFTSPSLAREVGHRALRGASERAPLARPSPPMDSDEGTGNVASGDPSAPQTSDDDSGAGRFEKGRAAIVEVIGLYAVRYQSDFPMLGAFIQTVWQLLVQTSLAVKNDVVCATRPTRPSRPSTTTCTHAAPCCVCWATD